jgi:hypothetical protein
VAVCHENVLRFLMRHSPHAVTKPPLDATLARLQKTPALQKIQSEPQD